MRDVKPRPPAKPTRAAKPERGSSRAAKSERKPAPKKARPAAEPRADGTVVAGVRLTNPGRVLYPGERLTKEDVARYYEAVAERMLPFVARRPLTLVRCPEGHTAECFYQKHGGVGTPEAIRRIPIPERGKTAEYLMVDSPAGLVSLVQMGVLEVHVWGSTTKRLEHPDQIVMDLDPDPDLPWDRMVEAARLVRERLEAFDLQAFVKTTGGKGLHVVSPLVPRADWDEVKAFTKAIADRLSAEQPDRYLAVMTKAKRKGKIFVDYLRNGRGATAIAPYSTRARAGATVAAPIRWEELGPALAPGKRPFHLGNVPDRAARADAWAGYEAARRPLSPRALKAAGVG